MQSVHVGLALAVLTLSACTSVPIDGGGTTNRGESVVGEVLVDPMNSGNHLFIHSPQGWVCRSIYLEDTRRFQAFQRDIPLMCSNGTRGTAVIKGTANAQRLRVEFRLDDGTAGKVAVGQLKD